MANNGNFELKLGKIEIYHLKTVRKGCPQPFRPPQMWVYIYSLADIQFFYLLKRLYLTHCVSWHPCQRSPQLVKFSLCVQRVWVQNPSTHSKKKLGIAPYNCDASAGRWRGGSPGACWPDSLSKSVTTRFSKTLNKMESGPHFLHAVSYTQICSPHRNIGCMWVGLCLNPVFCSFDLYARTVF